MATIEIRLDIPNVEEPYCFILEDVDQENAAIAANHAGMHDVFDVNWCDWSDSGFDADNLDTVQMWFYNEWSFGDFLADFYMCEVRL